MLGDLRLLTGVIEELDDAPLRERLTTQILTERSLVERWSGFDQEPILELHIDMGHTTTTASTRGPQTSEAARS